MKFINKIEVTEDEYLEKRYEVAKQVLSNVVTQDNIDNLGEAKLQASLIFNCISMSDALLKELGYFYKPKSKDETSIHKLSDLLDKDKG